MLKVIDLGAGMAPALIVRHLADFGASVTRLVPRGGDPFDGRYPAMDIWRAGVELIEDLGEAGRLDALLAQADVCITGGEDHPELPRRTLGLDVLSRHPRLIVLDIEGGPAGTRHAGRAATDILMQARSGLAFEHYSKRPLLMGFEPTAYGAALHGLIGLYAALLQREEDGRGQRVSTSIYEGALSWPHLFWWKGEKPTPAARFVTPKDPWPLIFRCADGVFIQVVLGSFGSKGRLYRILQIDDPSVDINDSGMPKPTADVKNFFGDIDTLAAHVAKFQSRELLAAIWAAGLPAEPVLPPGGCWDEPQVVINGSIVREPDGTRRVGAPMVAHESPAKRTDRPRSAAAPHDAPRPPLAGLRVIDFGAFVAGPYVSALLSDLGADVIKIEPISGEPSRGMVRSYAGVNRGKRCVALDMKSEEGLRIARQLCLSADVVVNNFRPGVSARLGVDATTLHKSKPELVVLECSAYGVSGPKAQNAGFDMCFQALCGHDYRAGGTGNPPLWNRTSMVDFATGMIGAVAIIQRLYVRARSGAGARIDTSLLSTGLFLLSQLVQRPDGRFEGAPLLDASQTGLHPAERFYECADGWIAVCARGDAMARRLVDALSLPKAMSATPANWDARDAEAIAAALKSLASAEAVRRLESAQVWTEPCCTDGQSLNLDDPDLARQGTLYEATHPVFGRIVLLGSMSRLSRAAPAPRRPDPLPGEHTGEILRELGRSDTEILGLRERKVVA